jgi:hypothetical protein
MNQTQKQDALPGMAAKIILERDSFKKDQNFVVVPAAELEDVLTPGDNITLATMMGDQESWAGDGVVTHFMSCYVLDIPTFVLTAHQDPMLKNPMALYNHLQGRLSRRVTPIDLVYCIGFRPIATS